MKRQLGIAVIALLVTNITAAGSAESQQHAAKTCIQTAYTQLEMNECASTSFQRADAELNSVFQQILKEYGDDTVFIEKLRISQRAWIVFRDAELDALFPKTGNRRRVYGSVFPMCWSYALGSLTRTRTAELRRWLNGTEEGDVCAGSVRW